MTTKHYYVLNILAVGLMVSEEKIFFLSFFPIISIWELMTPRAWPVWTQGLDWQVYIGHHLIC